jgi:hypothetical protein
MSPEWISKHQYYIPSVFVSFFDFTTDPARNSLTDNQLKTEINNIKGTLYRSEYKIKLVVVLISDKTINEAPEIEERLGNIRRATGLDAKTSFFFLPPNSSPAELHTFVDGVLTALQPGCVEYYRDLTKHARRKKNRGNIPAPTAPPTKGTSQTLAALGWSIRYDFKLGVFAEFRQEMESACRHYTAALESLLGPDGIFETTASWSPRWEEARLLADMIAMRILRCLLWGNLTTTAVQSWSNYRHRLRELMDRRGKGSSNYGWEAWESRWSRVMAELVRRAQVSAFAKTNDAREQILVYAPVEKAIPVGERIRPSDHLHHPGYWLRIAAKHGRRRRRFAQDLPKEDCTPPGQSPASAMASRYGTYDTYLCSEPWQERPNSERKTYNHSKDVFNALEKAQGHFRAQPRSRSELCLDMARELVRNKQYPEAMKMLFQLWKSMSWRRDQWWDLVFEVTRALRDVSKQLGDVKVLAATEFELYCRELPPIKNHEYDLGKCGDGVVASKEESLIGDEVIELDAEKIASFIDARLTFAVGEGNAGEPVQAQLAVTSTAQTGSASVKFDAIDVALAGSPFAIRLGHLDTHDTEPRGIQELILGEAATGSVRVVDACLELSEGETRVYEFTLIFREAGSIAVENIVFTLVLPAATIRFTTKPEEMSERAHWYKTSPQGPITTLIPRDDAHTVQIHPRPPKMEVKLPNVSEHFYTDEQIELKIEVLNDEDEITESSLEVRLLTDDGLTTFTWGGAEDVPSSPSSPEADLPGYQIGTLQPSTSKSSSIVFTAPSLPTSYVVEVKVLYHLLSDPSTPVSKIFTADLNVTRAFEANYEFQPRVHPDAWSSFFDPYTVSASAVEASTASQHGTIQRWELQARIASFTYEGVIMTAAQLRQDSISSHATATFAPVDNAEQGDTEVAPQQQIDRTFTIDVTKTSLEDRRSVELELVLAITWHRPRQEGKKFTSLLPVNSFVLDNGPRVLASVDYPFLPPATGLDAVNDAENDASVPFVHLIFTLENPTNHFLSFELTMEGPQKDDWALSGIKMRSLNLLPLSREVVSYRIMPLAVDGEDAEGKWLEIRFRVMDVYFRKVLRCLPASVNVREAEGKSGALMVWVGGKEW